MHHSHSFRLSAVRTLTGALILGAITFPQAGAAAESGGANYSGAACARISTPHQAKDAETIQRIEQAWLTAEYTGHREYLECLLEPDYHTSSRSGLIRSRQDVIDRVPQAPQTREVPKLQTIVMIHGSAASAHSILKTTDKPGKPKEVHFVDTYSFHDGKWLAFSGADL
jgi:hypothetical protein